MFVQERANMVLWNLRNRADTTDATLENHREGGEEEPRTIDPVIETETHSSQFPRRYFIPAGTCEARSEYCTSGRALDRSQSVARCSGHTFARYKWSRSGRIFNESCERYEKHLPEVVYDSQEQRAGRAHGTFPSLC